MRIGKRAVVVTAGTAVVLAAAGGVAVATVGGEEGGEDLTRPGTVAVDESTLPEDDAEESEALADLATVDEAAAVDAAVESVGGEVVRAELEEEDGFVVWEVEVRGDDGTLHEVTIDAGDAGVLGTEAEDDDTDDTEDAEDTDDTEDADGTDAD
ncbi:PepSY domain-containing protein [Blastococcus tunisiensis]|uniref:Peptidase propeptide and YPEB domain-containing protein n=1 Tax=Blastococcus tunisiensis TaxID=1798228 RepID=A0A1I2EVB3_9ACTN|nr:PepSY domain-containing protein [Blastococcus sp. DSM 46838]SFE96673.1 Peptidase propeptide and YPEB domain-containing protein [Blastococcus sp. DSM 46838]